MIKKMLPVLLILGLLLPVTAFAADCELYDEAIVGCAKDGCDTDIDDFAECLVEEHGITPDEINELVECLYTQYECKE